MLDTDPRHGGDEHLHDLEHEHGEVLPRTLSVKTPGGGAHYYFAHPDVEVPCDRDLAGHRGVDIKADGGYVVVPPSRTDLGVYALDELAPLAPMPGWLVELTTVVDDERGPVDPDEVVTAFVAGIRSGRDPALTQLTGMLLRHFVPVDVTRLIVHAVNQRLLQAAEAAGGRREDRRLDRGPRGPAPGVVVMAPRGTPAGHGRIPRA